MAAIPGLRKLSLFRHPTKTFVYRTAQFLYLALGNLNINLQIPIGLVSHWDGSHNDGLRDTQ